MAARERAWYNSAMSLAGEVGGEIAGYRIQSVLATGGMGVVYLAERPQGGLCALKVLSRQLGIDPGFAARFKREAQYAAALDHPHIVELYDAGETADGTLFLAMQYVPGPDLRVLLARDGALDLARALSILGQIGDALDCAHAKGLVHRDVKPANIIVTDDRGSGPYAYLTDFGLSKNPSEDSIELTKKGQLIGTTAYTAPEEILDEPRAQLVDIYSLGCVLYEALAGAPPFVRDRELDVLYAHIGDARPKVTDSRPDLPPEMDAIVAKAMAISPADRFASATEFIQAASALLPERALPAAAPGAGRSGSAASSSASAAPPAPTSPAPERTPEPIAERTPEPIAALRLVVRAGFGLGRELVVEDEIELGRLTTLEGALGGDRGISRRHARVYRAADGGFVVEDEDSANGTFVNGVRIAGPHPLRPGDELRMGSTVFAASPAGAREPVGQPPGAVASGVMPGDAGVAVEGPASQTPSPDAAPANGAAGSFDTAAPSSAAVEASGSEPVEPGAHPEIPRAAASPPPARRLALRLELDLEAGEMVIAIDDGAQARIVRDGEGWRVDIP
jgi:hypothetical protein